LKILQIYKDYYPPVKGGIENHLNLLANGLAGRGHQIQVLVSNTGMNMEIEDHQGIRIFKVPQLGRISSAPLNPTLPCWIRKLGAGADILHFHFPNPSAEFSFLLSGLKKKFVVTYHSDIIRQVRTKKIYEPWMHRFLKRAEKIIVTSPQYLQTSETLRRYKQKCVLIPLGIDPARFQSHPKDGNDPEKLRKIHGAPIILFVGKLRYYKGVHVLIQAMQDIDAKLLLIGPALESSQIAQQISAANVNAKVDVLGELPDEVLSGYLNACDLFVLPSVRRSEAFGIVQLEAMACAKPVVCTELGTGTSYVNLHQKTGLVVPPDNPKALAEAINLLLDNPDLATRFGRNGLERVRTLFSLETMIKSMETLYHQIIGN